MRNDVCNVLPCRLHHIMASHDAGAAVTQFLLRSQITTKEDEAKTPSSQPSKHLTTTRLFTGKAGIEKKQTIFLLNVDVSIVRVVVVV